MKHRWIRHEGKAWKIDMSRKKWRRYARRQLLIVERGLKRKLTREELRAFLSARERHYDESTQVGWNRWAGIPGTGYGDRAHAPTRSADQREWP